MDENENENTRTTTTRDVFTTLLRQARAARGQANRARQLRGVN